jgi:hypothetical protein
MGIQKDKLSEEQKKEVERLRNFVSRNRLSPQMNGTKWRAAIDAIQNIPGYAASFRVKCVTDAQDPSEKVWDEAFPKNIPLYNAIEWLEFNPKGFREDITRELTAARIPITGSKDGIRIIGYARDDKK